MRLHPEPGRRERQCAGASGVVWGKGYETRFPSENICVTHCDLASSLKSLARPPWAKTEQIGHQGLRTRVASSTLQGLELV